MPRVQPEKGATREEGTREDATLEIAPQHGRKMHTFNFRHGFLTIIYIRVYIVKHYGGDISIYHGETRFKTHIFISLYIYDLHRWRTMNAVRRHGKR